MIELLDLPALGAAGLAGIGVLQVTAGWEAVRRFGRQAPAAPAE